MKYLFSLLLGIMIAIFIIACGGDSGLAPSGSGSRIVTTGGTKAANSNHLISMNSSISTELATVQGKSKARRIVGRTFHRTWRVADKARYGTYNLDQSELKFVENFASSQINGNYNYNCEHGGYVNSTLEGSVSYSETNLDMEVKLLYQFDMCRDRTSILVDGYLGMGLKVSANQTSGSIELSVNGDIGGAYNHQNVNFNISVQGELKTDLSLNMNALSSLTATGDYTVKVGGETWKCSGTAGMSQTTTGYTSPTYSASPVLANCTKQ